MNASLSYSIRTESRLRLHSSIIPTIGSLASQSKNAQAWSISASSTSLTTISISASLSLSSCRAQTQVSAIRSAWSSYRTKNSYISFVVWLRPTIRKPCMRMSSIGSSSTTWSCSCWTHSRYVPTSVTMPSSFTISSSISRNTKSWTNSSMIKLALRSRRFHERSRLDTHTSKKT